MICEPDDPLVNGMVVQPKYGGCCYKMQVAVNHSWWIVLYTGLHHGAVPDNTIFAAPQAQIGLRSWEFWAADGIYDSCDGIITRFIQDGGGVLTQFEVFMNRQVGFFTVDAHSHCRLLCVGTSTATGSESSM